ncbi:hypothetical protein WA026_018047 [Henosepilachna vigintioctopunctata]|uniref:Fatty acid hydroxylase domain-containing protein n=1 Tax=Henosepilachna vigintioctopunctata TaxID=420089 RepID=A0AAW1UFP5_9CUCU
MPSEKQSVVVSSPRIIVSNWLRYYDKELAYIWSKIPNPLKKVLVSLAIFTFGISVSGDWMNLRIHISRQLGFNVNKQAAIGDLHWSFDSIGLKNFWIYFISGNLVSFGIYFTVGGFLQWYFYIRQKDHPETWKCQPTRFLTPELERNEFFLGCLTLFFNGTGSSILSCYIANGGYSTVYYEFSEYGWAWFILQFPVLFIYEDYMTYWMHRFLHTPWLYKHFHKLHHAFKQPTVWSVTAIHPVESLFMQGVLVTPLFLFPIHWCEYLTSTVSFNCLILSYSIHSIILYHRYVSVLPWYEGSLWN